MSLQDKLEENRSIKELFQETKELNELMTSYIRVQMNEDMAQDVTIHNQLNQIQETSNQVMKNMESILMKQEKLLKDDRELLQAILTNGQEEMQENNRKTVHALQRLQQTNDTQLNEMSNEIRGGINHMKNNLNGVVKNAKKEAKNLVSNVKHDAFIANWIDALKYGAATSAITVPVLYLLLS